MTAQLLQLSGVIADIIYAVNEVPSSGEEAIVTGFEIAPGGGFNAMVAARRAGINVGYAGSVGTGPFAQIVIDGLLAEDIAILRSPEPQCDQGCCTVLIDTHGERTFIASGGSEEHVSEDALIGVENKDFGWALLSGYALHYAGSRGAIVHWLQHSDSIPNLVFDPSPIVSALNPEILECILQRAQWISANAKEAFVLTGRENPAEAAKILAQSRPHNGGVVIRDGEKGCIVACNGTHHVIPGHEVDAIDTNGAGDAHIGSFIAMLAQSESPLVAAQYANIAAALSTTRSGPATAPDRSDVEHILKTKKADQLPETITPGGNA
ncbi:PfkB family carbohydrate kinase [Cochlodiniinecator piscidefendens]|uniref:PfkB family carbohydrate kinase n=1 Tax=Cochlodiniinecator piscidefendens TaxID=2715756 RepID=UPI001409B298|nr:PfkB family carbohydrate kinase [Cochlodiniinecator piscidefendens]